MSSKSLRPAWSIVNKLSPVLVCTLLATIGQPALAMDTLMPRIVHEACTEFEKGKLFDVLARFEDESQLFDPKVIYRTRSDSHWKHAAFTKDADTENFRATIKSRELRGPLEYFIEVFDEYGNGPARMGSPDAPIRVVPARAPDECQQIPVAAAVVTTTEGSKNPKNGIDNKGPPPPKDTCDLEDRPLYCEAWLWATVGTVAAAGAATGIYFLVANGGDDPPPPIDSVTLIVTGANPTLMTP